jgi:hypothetical protein
MMAYTGMAEGVGAQQESEAKSAGGPLEKGLSVEDEGIVKLILATLTRPAGKRRSKLSPAKKKLFDAVVRRCEPHHVERSE